MFDGLIGDGIFASIGDCFVVKKGTESTVNVGTGKAWFNHTWTLNDAVLPIDCGEADRRADMARIDAVVIEVNTTDAVRTNTIKVINGTPSSKPNRPTLINESGVYQHALCYITRPGGVNEITQANITNMVGTAETPFVTGIVDVISVDELCDQWRTQLDEFVASEKSDVDVFILGQKYEFNKWFEEMRQLMADVVAETTQWTEGRKKSFDDWFDEMKDQLSVDAAGNLQIQIDNEELKRMLMFGFVAGTKSISEDGTVITSIDPKGNKLVKTFTDDFATCTTELFDVNGAVVGKMVKTFSEDGSTINTETTIKDVTLTFVNGDEITY